MLFVMNDAVVGVQMVRMLVVCRWREEKMNE